MTVADALTGIAIAGLGLLGVLVAQITTRVHSLEDDLAAAHQYNRRLWDYTRRLLDMYYRHRRDDAPDPPPLPEDSKP